MDHLKEQTRLAVLIDADNARVASVQSLLAVINNYGVAIVKRAYGDWTTSHLAGWKSVLNENAVQPIQQFCYTSGKNSTDSALIIDAMDLLYTGRFQGFCIVSSDSDFTRLATRLRESAMKVYGFGEQKTPLSFVKACHKFIYTNDATTVSENKEAPAAASSPSKWTAKELRADAGLVKVLKAAVQLASEADGWAHLGTVGNKLAILAGDFDTRSYGYAKFGALIIATELFGVQERKDQSGNQQKYIKIKPTKK